MQTIGNKLRLIGFVILVSLCVNKLNAQTPADDPLIGGPGAGSAPAGDGSPIVPFDNNLNLAFLLTGMAYTAYKLNSNKQRCIV